MSLEADIANWDGKSSRDLAGVFDRHASDAGFLAELIEHTESEALQKGATWLIKRFVERSGEVRASEAERLLQAAHKFKAWESKMHVLQCLPHMSIPASCRITVEALTRAGIEDRKVFLRAWAYGGFYELARQYPQYRKEAEQLMEMGLIDEPASVRARIRQVAARGFSEETD